jgi:hypothetical protein
MPRKTFTAGEVLAAADVNEYLMDQSVMTFADSGARGSAIGTAIAQEGMLTYLEDTDAFEYWDGSAFTAFGGGGAATTNAIINGAFEINQRGYASAGTLASGEYGFDRWKASAADTTLTFTSAPQGQEIEINSGKSIKQVVERANIPAGTYTLSWTGTATGRVYNTGGAAPSYAASPITVTLDGLENVDVEFEADGGTQTLSKVQLEAGSTATSFRRNANSYEGELAACQRYYLRNLATGYFANGQVRTTTQAEFWHVFPTTMRAAPAALEQSGTAAEYSVRVGNTNIACSAVPTFSGSSIYGGLYQFTVASGLTVGNSAFARPVGGFLAWSAEL